MKAGPLEFDYMGQHVEIRKLLPGKYLVLINKQERGFGENYALARRRAEEAISLEANPEAGY